MIERAARARCAQRGWDSRVYILCNLLIVIDPRCDETINRSGRVDRALTENKYSQIQHIYYIPTQKSHKYAACPNRRTHRHILRATRKSSCWATFLAHRAPHKPENVRVSAVWQPACLGFLVCSEHRVVSDHLGSREQTKTASGGGNRFTPLTHNTFSVIFVYIYIRTPHISILVLHKLFVWLRMPRDESSCLRLMRCGLTPRQHIPFRPFRSSSVHSMRCCYASIYIHSICME